MIQAFPDAMVTGYGSLIAGKTNDRKNLPVLRAQAAYQREPKTVAELLVRLERTGLGGFAAEARRHL